MDFTSVAMNAFKYAYDMFKNNNLYIIHVTINVGKNPEIFGGTPGQTNREFLTKELSAWLKHELNFKTLPENISINVERGEATEVIRKISKKFDFDYVVMGTRDNYSLFDKWLGTISLSLVKTIDIPIFLIPRYSRYTKFKKVLIASDNHINDERMLQNISTWNNNYKSHLDFLHISDSSDDEFQKKSNLAIRKYFAENNLNYGFEVTSAMNADISKTILANAYNKQANLIMMLPDDQSFINSLIFRSISKDMILSSDIPLLFLKRKDNINASFVNIESIAEGH